MATSTIDQLYTDNHVTSVHKNDRIVIQDDPEGTPEDGATTVNELLAAPVDKTILNLGSEPSGNPAAGIVWRWASSADKKTYIKDSDGNVTLESAGTGAGTNQVAECRITPTTGVPIETADQASITELYITPFEGDQVRIYNGSTWQIYTFSEITVKITNTLTGCAYTSGSAVITVSDSSDLIIGMVADGTGIPAGAVISTIDSATQVTLDQNTTSTVPGGSVDFMIPSDTNVDVFLYSDSGTIKHKQVLWTDATTRATALTTQDSIKVLTGQTGWLYIGKYHTRETDGETDWDAQERNIQNHYNKRRFKWFVFHNDSSSTSSSFRKWNSADADSKIYGLFDDDGFVDIKTDGMCVLNGAGTTGYLQHGIGIDSDTVDSADYSLVGVVIAGDESSRHPVSCGYSGTVAEGFHYVCGLDKYITNASTHVFPILRVTGGFLG